MEISKLDKNFKRKEENHKQNDIYSVPSEHFNLYGCFYDEKYGFLRIPYDVACQTSETVQYINTFPAGGRIVFKSNTTYVKLHVQYDALAGMYHMPNTALAGFSLCEITPKGYKHVCTYGPTNKEEKGYVMSCGAFKKKDRIFILFFPLYNGVRKLDVEVSKNSYVEPANVYKDVKPVLFYGSSITEGGCASRTDNTYQNFLLEKYNLDYINLGFSGGAKGEDAMRDYVCNIDCSVFVFDYDHNAPNPEHLKKTHEIFFLQFRKIHPTTPVIFMTNPNYKGTKEQKERWNIIHQTYLNAINKGDENVYFVSGKNMFPRNIREHVTVDGIHPTDLGFLYMAKSLDKIFKKLF